MRARIATAAVLALALASPPAAAAEAETRRAAERLVGVVLTPETVDSMIERMVDSVIAGEPRLEPYHDVLRGFYDRHLGHGPMTEFMTEVYAENFTAGEMDDIRAFYETPTGQKARRIMPRMFRIGARWGRRQVMEHREELVEELQAAMKERQGSAGEER